ncbi:unnamed protein product [Boreogadus saida]
MVVMSESGLCCALNLDTRLELEYTSGLRGPHPTSQPDVDSEVSSALLSSFSPAFLSTEQKPCEAQYLDMQEPCALLLHAAPCLREAGPASVRRGLPQWGGACLRGAGPASVGF